MTADWVHYNPDYLDSMGLDILVDYTVVARSSSRVERGARAKIWLARSIEVACSYLLEKMMQEISLSLYLETKISRINNMMNLCSP